MFRTITVECEAEACNKAKEWGFSGLGTDIDFCYGRIKRLFTDGSKSDK